MIKLSLKDTGAFLGSIDEADFRLLVDQLEEESEGDTDYFVAPETIEMLEEGGASAGLVRMLRNAVGDSEGVEIAWQKS